MNKEYKSFGGLQSKVLDGEQGIVEHIVAVMGNVDLGDDVIWPGAFSKTLQERGLNIKVCDQHKTDSIMRVLGHPLEMRELQRGELPPELLILYPEATGGLYAKTQYNLATPEGRGAFDRIKAGDITEYSIGYDPIQADYSTLRGGDGKEKTIRNLREVRLWEYSPVIFGMNPATLTLSAKTVIPPADLPLAPRDRAWDAAAAEARVRTWAEAGDAPNAQYRRAFMWYDAENAEQFGAYKLQFADVIDGELYAIPRAIFAIAGGRGVDRADIPDADKDRVRGMVNRWYAKMRSEFEDDSMVSPFEKELLMDFTEKAGRAISKANGRRIMTALAALHDGVSAIEEMLSEYGIGETEPEGAEPDDSEETDTQKAGAGPQTAPTPPDDEIEMERVKLLLEIEMES